jgi:hypothetical protein
MFIQMCAALMDWIVFLVQFAALYGAGERHLSGLQCAWLGGIGQITYMVTSLAVGHILSRRNAKGLLLASTAGGALIGVACISVKGFVPLLLWLALFGVCLATFFNSFQTFMRGETEPGGLAATVGRYTLAWSTGSGMGFLSSGSLYRLGPVPLSLLTLLVGGVIFASLLRHRSRSESASSADEHVEHAPAGHRPVDARFVWVAWCIIFTAMFVQRPVQTLFPAVCARDGIAPFLPGVVLTLHMLVQAGWGYRVASYGSWRYRRTPLALAHVGGALAFAAAWLWPSFRVSALALSAAGLYTGFAYFAAVYYASNSGRRSFNVGVNECLVGLGSFAGLFVSQWWMKRTGNDAVMYAVCAAALLVSLAVQLVVIALPRQAPDAAKAPSPATEEC